MIRGIKKRQVEELIGKLALLQEELEGVQTQLNEYYDERSEAWQTSEAGDNYLDKLMDIECMIGNIEDAQGVLTNWIEE